MLTPSFFSPVQPFQLVHKCTTWWIQSKGAQSAVLSLQIVKDYMQTEISFHKWLGFQPQRRMWNCLKYPKLFLSESCLCNQVCLCLSPLQKFLLFPPASQYAPKVELENPSSVTISSMHVMVFNTRTQLLLEPSETRLYRVLTACRCRPLCFLCFLRSPAKDLSQSPLH